MNTKELLEILRNPPDGEINVSMSKDGTFLTMGGVQRTLTDEQAEILWEVLPLVMKLRALKSAHPLKTAQETKG